MIQIPDEDVPVLQDLHETIKASPLLWECYLGLPQHERDAVDAIHIRKVNDRLLTIISENNEIDKLIEILEEKKDGKQ